MGNVKPIPYLGVGVLGGGTRRNVTFNKGAGNSEWRDSVLWWGFCYSDATGGDVDGGE